MDPIDEIKLLLKELKRIRSQLSIVIEEDRDTVKIIETYQRIANLSTCLEKACWKIFGTREADNLQHIIKKK